MIVDTRPDSGPVLLEADDFTSLKVVAREEASLAEVAGPLGAREDEDGAHLWISADGLRRLAGDVPAAWQAGFDAMLAKVEPFGWYDAAGARVKAHVERG